MSFTGKAQISNFLSGVGAFLTPSGIFLPLSGVLTLGNSNGGTGILLEVDPAYNEGGFGIGQRPYGRQIPNLFGADVTSGLASNVAISGGSAPISGRGGHVFILSGSGVNAGGQIDIVAGKSHGTNAAGASIWIVAGEAGGNTSPGGTAGGNLNIYGGRGSPVKGAGGNVDIRGGIPFEGEGGDGSLIAGNAASGVSGGSYSGGTISIRSGRGIGGFAGGFCNFGGTTNLDGPGGVVSVIGQSSQGGAGGYNAGDVRISAGWANTGGDGGNVDIGATGGNAGQGANGGDINIDGGAGLAGQGGAITATAGNGTTGGGNAVWRAGAAAGGSNANGGLCSLAGGNGDGAGVGGDVWLTAGGGPNPGTVKINANGAGSLSFFNAAGSTQPTITGSRAGNAALASLLTALANLGLVVDSTTA